MASGGAAAGAAMDNAARQMRDCVIGIANSHWFNKEDFKNEIRRRIFRAKKNEKNSHIRLWNRQ